MIAAEIEIPPDDAPLAQGELRGGTIEAASHLAIQRDRLRHGDHTAIDSAIEDDLLSYDHKIASNGAIDDDPWPYHKEIVVHNDLLGNVFGVEKSRGQCSRWQRKQS